MEIETVIMGFAVAKYPNGLYTYGIGPCIGVGILNIKEKKAYLGHFINQDKEAKQLIDLAVHEAKYPSHLEIAIAGNMCLSREVIENECQDNYENVLQGHKLYSNWIRETIQSHKIISLQDHFHETFRQGSYSILVDTKRLDIVVRYTD
jgi:enolase